MARILLSAYACEPGRGSEPGVGWSWATELARLGHQVSVVTRTANRAAIEQVGRQDREDVRFIYYELPRWILRWRKSRGGKTLYYVLWQFFAVRHLRRLFPALPFDLVHHVTYVSARFPSFMGSLGIPFWFGPVSGGESVPLQLRAEFPAAQRWREQLRALSNFLVRVDPWMRRTFRQADRILVTKDTLALVPERWRHRCMVRLAIGLSDRYRHTAPLPGNRRAPGLQLIYVGRLLEWKGVDIALRAIGQARHSRPDLRFTVVGDGPAKPRLIGLCQDLKLQQIVRWIPWLPQSELAGHYRTADLLFFPSLRDSGGMVVLEALAHGLPVLCTTLGGPGRIVNSTCGRAISVDGRTAEQLADAMAEALLELTSNPDLLKSLREGARARAHQFDFADLVRSIYPVPSPRPLARQA
jgi:glycosyltransferase involved in cell wall biosynthesis